MLYVCVRFRLSRKSDIRESHIPKVAVTKEALHRDLVWETKTPYLSSERILRGSESQAKFS